MDKLRNINVMGIVNLTSDSFFSGSRYLGADVLRVVERMLTEGASSIDFGACSTRPGSEYVTAKTEWERLSPVVGEVRRNFPGVKISVDTFRSEIVKRCLDADGIDIVNDISAGEEDDAMLPLVAQTGLSYVAMHKRGVPSSMQSLCDYGELGVVASVKEYFEKFSAAAENLGIRNWMLDPGFGFAKTVEQNYELLDSLPELRVPGVPLFVGVSRKSFIYKPLGLTPETCLEQTQEVHLRALMGGADVLRVHDVAQTVDTVRRYRVL